MFSPRMIKKSKNNLLREINRQPAVEKYGRQPDIPQQEFHLQVSLVDHQKLVREHCTFVYAEEEKPAADDVFRTGRNPLSMR